MLRWMLRWKGCAVRGGNSLQRLREIREGPATARALAIQIIPAVVTFKAAAASAVAEVGLLKGDHADLAAALVGSRAEHAIPPLFVCGEDRDAVFNTELAAAMFEAPAGFIANHESAAGTGKREGGGVEAAIA